MDYSFELLKSIAVASGDALHFDFILILTHSEHKFGLLVKQVFEFLIVELKHLEFKADVFALTAPHELARNEMYEPLLLLTTIDRESLASTALPIRQIHDVLARLDVLKQLGSHRLINPLKIGIGRHIH